MNEEQKEFINKLLKDSNINQEQQSCTGAALHGRKKSRVSNSNVSKSRVNKNHLDVETNYTYNSKPAVYNNLFKYIKPTTVNTKSVVKKILVPILESGNYNEFLNWVGTTKYYSSYNYTKRLYDVCLKLLKENELNKYYDKKTNQILDIPVENEPLNINDLETSKNEATASATEGPADAEKSNLEDLVESTKVMMSPKNEKKPFKPDEEILIENDEKSSTIDEEKSSENKEKSSTIDEEKSSENKEKLSIEETKTETEPSDKSSKSTVVTLIPADLPDKEKELFKNIELALSYKNNKEYQDNNVLEFKHKTGKIYEPEKPSEKLKALVHQQIAKYMKYLKNKKLPESQFIKLKQEIINKINERYFGDNNEYGFKVYNKKSNKGAIEIKDLEDSKQKRRVKKNYVNQNAPNKFSFFVYNMKDIYSIIEEYFEISLSVHSKTLIESIVRTSVDKYVRIADKSGQISYHTIPHGITEAKEDVVKLIEKYINSKRNIHIKSKFEFDSDSRSKLMEIINKEINRNKNDFKQKSKNIISFIDHLKFF